MAYEEGTRRRSPHHGSTAYISPSLQPQQHQHHSNWNQNGSGSGGGQRGPPPSFQDTVAQRPGTDPSKFKTTICRNWEQTGTCPFRGCTFAHGVEELRPPGRTGGSPPPVTTSPPMQPTPPHPKSSLEGLLENLQVDVRRHRDLQAVQIEANRTLESMLTKEYQMRHETQNQISEAKHQLEELERLLAAKEAQLGGTSSFGESPFVAVTSPLTSNCDASKASPTGSMTDRGNLDAGSGSSIGVSSPITEENHDRLRDILSSLSQLQQDDA